MGSKAYDISLIKGYLHGNLDAYAMHKLERKAQDDPFLMDALDGYNTLKNRHFSLEDLTIKLHGRLANSKKKIFVMWPLIATIIAVLAFALIGAWWLLVYMPQLKNHQNNPVPVNKTAPQQKVVSINPKSKPDIKGVTATSDTVKKDTVKIKYDPAQDQKTTLQPQKPRDPSKGSVDPSTVIADLNRQPYSIDKHKTPDNNPVRGEMTTPVNVKSTHAVTSSNFNTASAKATGKDPSSGVGIKNKEEVTHPKALRDNDQLAGAVLNKSLSITHTVPTPVIKGSDIINITGQVLAADNSKPISGAALRIIGTQTGTITDANGRFSIRMSKAQQLQVNFLGFFGVLVTPAGTDIKIVLQPVKNINNETPANNR